MKLLRFLALFFATFTRRHRKPPTARTPSREKTEEELAQEYVENAIAQLERIFAQWKAGTLPAHMLAKPPHARKTRKTADEDAEEAELSLKTTPTWLPPPPPRHLTPIQRQPDQDFTALRRTKSPALRTATHAPIVSLT